MKNRRRFATVLLILVLLLTSIIGSDFTFAGTDYKEVADLDGKVIGVQTSTLYEEEIADVCPNATIMYFTMPPDMINALNGGKIDAYLIEEAGYYEHKKNHPEITIVPENAGDCRGTVAISGKDKEKEARLLKELNEFIALHTTNGDLDEMYKYWIQDFDSDTSSIKDYTFKGENGVLRIGVEGAYEPFSFVSRKDGKEYDNGFDIDFISWFCQDYGYTPQFDRVAFEQIAPGVETGTYDLGMNIILSDERDDAVTLSDVYYSCGIFLVVPNNTVAESTKYKTVESLNGKVIGVQTSTLYEEEIADTCPDSTIMYFTMPPDMINALNGGKIDAYLIEEAGYYEHKKNHPEITIVPENAGDCRGTVAISGKDKEKEARLLKELNEFIALHTANGDLDEMYKYWIQDFDSDTSSIKDYTFKGENGVLRIGVEGAYEPFSFVSRKDGKEYDNGFDIDFISWFCQDYGYTPQFDRVAFEQIAPGVETGTYDLGMNIILSDERDDAVTLSDVYYSCGIFLVVPNEDYVKEVTFFDQIKQNFYNTFIKEERWKMFAEGAGLTCLITISSVLLGVIFGFILYMLCRKGSKIANGFAKVYNWLIDGMPTVVLLMILYYVVFGSTKLTGTVVSIIGFTMIFTSSMFDMLTVGFNAIGIGQVEAARALGYSDTQSFFKILLPQAARHFLPIAENEVVTLIKETSVAGYIAVMELTKISDLVRSRTYQAFFALIFTAIIYFVISGIMTAFIRLLEKQIDPKRRPKEKILEGVDTTEFE